MPLVGIIAYQRLFVLLLFTAFVSNCTNLFLHKTQIIPFLAKLCQILYIKSLKFSKIDFFGKFKILFPFQILWFYAIEKIDSNNSLCCNRHFCPVSALPFGEFGLWWAAIIAQIFALSIEYWHFLSNFFLNFSWKGAKKSDAQKRIGIDFRDWIYKFSRITKATFSAKRT